MNRTITTVQNQVVEWSYTSGKRYADPFNEVDLDVVIHGTNGYSWRVPAYWAGGFEWRVRFVASEPGTYTISTLCTDVDNPHLHGQVGTLEVAPHEADNPLMQRGRLRVASSRRNLEHADGTPFFWLGDTWWMGLCKRLSWSEDFQLLTADRVAKGFTLIQIVAGLYPDMPGFDPRSANEAGHSWEDDYARINPAYFDMADLRINWLVQSGLIPCIFGCWGYYLPMMGIEKMKQHWRYLVARWGALPVVWCLAGEGVMPYYLSTDRPGDSARQKQGWTEVGTYVRELDPFHNLIGIHPNEIGRDQVEDDSILDMNMLQAGHGGYKSVSNLVLFMNKQREREPLMPVVADEVNYEGILHNCHDEVQRLAYWSSTLSGGYGFTYGANGVWQVNTKENPYGASPHGGNWGITPWEEAYRLPGATQLGLARRLLERFPWWEFEPHQDWVEPSGSSSNTGRGFAAGVPGVVRIIYFYDVIFAWGSSPYITNLEPDVEYEAYYWDPTNGDEYPLGAVIPDGDNRWQIPFPPYFHDWVLVLQRKS